MKFKEIMEAFNASEDDNHAGRAACPVHERDRPDAHPSLIIDVGPDDKVLICCQSRSCPNGMILSAVGLRFADINKVTAIPADAKRKKGTHSTPATLTQRQEQQREAHKRAVALTEHLKDDPASPVATMLADRFGLRADDVINYAGELGLGINAAADRLVVIARDVKGLYIYAQGRAADPSVEPKWLGDRNPEDAQWGAAGFIGRVRGDRPVVITEGPSDGLTVASLDEYDVVAIRGATNGYRIAELSDSLKGRRVYVVPDNDDASKGTFLPEVINTLRGVAASIRVIHVPDELNDVGDVRMADPDTFRERFAGLITQADDNADGAALLDHIERTLRRFVVYPSEAACVAHTLWIAHTHAMDRWDSTPRLAFMSPEAGSGKTRALEVTGPMVPNPVHALECTPAYIVRKVANQEAMPTLLYDEIDTVFGPRASGNEEIRGLLNAGHRQGAVVGRAVAAGNDGVVTTEELPAYSPVALAGLHYLPDTITSRGIIVNMRKRGRKDRPVEQWRDRTNRPEVAAIGERLAQWAATQIPAPGEIEWPEMPEGITDRNADVWEALIVVADIAGGDWPRRARAAACEFVEATKSTAPSIGVMLLRDIKLVFAAAGSGIGDGMPTADLIHGLRAVPESPWNTVNDRQEIDPLWLARALAEYGIKPTRFRVAGTRVRGYTYTSFMDAWDRYLPDESADEHAVNAEDIELPPSPIESVQPRLKAIR